jgi:hypothetical protein
MGFFAVAQKHFEERTNAYLLEVTAIDAAYRGASLWIQPVCAHDLEFDSKRWLNARD